jgi:hypothetical protein
LIETVSTIRVCIYKKIEFVCIDQEKREMIVYEVNRLSISRKNLFIVLFCLLVKHLSEDDLIYSITYLLSSSFYP